MCIEIITQTHMHKMVMDQPYIFLPYMIFLILYTDLRVFVSETHLEDIVFQHFIYLQLS